MVHYIRYRLTSVFHPGMMKHGGIELCNLCNLSCHDCPTPNSRVLKGFATDQTVRLALRHAEPGQVFSFHRLGEPLLHPKLVAYVGWASHMGLKPLVSTNGVLLDRGLLEALQKAGLSILFISLHTKKSAESFKLAADCLLRTPIADRQFSLQGNLLTVNAQFDTWAHELGFTPEHLQFVKTIETHTWAGNVEGKQIAFDDKTVIERMNCCHFLRSNSCSVRWDGTVVSCCFDSENINVVGRILDFPNLRHQTKGYKLCRYCDSNWAIQDNH